MVLFFSLTLSWLLLSLTAAYNRTLQAEYDAFVSQFMNCSSALDFNIDIYLDEYGLVHVNPHVNSLERDEMTFLVGCQEVNPTIVVAIHDSYEYSPSHDDYCNRGFVGFAELGIYPDFQRYEDDDDDDDVIWDEKDCGESDRADYYFLQNRYDLGLGGKI